MSFGVLTRVGLITAVSVTISLAAFQNCSRQGASGTSDGSSLQAGIGTLGTGSGGNYCATAPSDPSCVTTQAPGCKFDGKAVASGSSVTAYLSSTGANCISETRTCTGTSLSGSYAYATCGVRAAAACLFNGQTVRCLVGRGRLLQLPGQRGSRLLI